MNKSAALIAAFLLCALPSFAQKKNSTPPKKAAASAIVFQGAPQYSQDELLAAAGLTPNARLNSAEVRARYFVVAFGPVT